MFSTKIVRWGNSQGLRIPKALLEQIGAPEEVTVEIVDGQLVIRPVLAPRHNWRAQFEALGKEEEQNLLEGPSNDWDDEEWEW